MIAVVDVKIQAENPAFPLWPMRAYVGSPSSIRVRGVPRQIGEWQISGVSFVANYPDNTSQSVECKLVGGVYVGTIDGSTRSGKVSEGYSILAEGKDENGNSISGYVLGKGDIEILPNSTEIKPDGDAYAVRLLSGESDTPKSGDMWLSGEAINIVDTDGITKTFEQPELSGYATRDELSAKQDKITANGILSGDGQGNITSADMSMYVKQYGLPVFNGLTALGSNYIDGYARISELTGANYMPIIHHSAPQEYEQTHIQPFAVNWIPVGGEERYSLVFDGVKAGQAIYTTVVVDCNISLPAEFQWPMEFMYWGTNTLQNGYANVFTFQQLNENLMMVKREIY